MSSPVGSAGSGGVGVQNNEVDHLDGPPPPPPAGPAKMAKADHQNSIASHPDPTAQDSSLEASLRKDFLALKPGDSMELDASLSLKLGFGADVRGKVKIECQKDSSLTVDFEQFVGVNAEAGAKEKLGIGTNDKFHVRTAAEAADLVDAAFKNQVALSFPTVTNFTGQLADNSYSSSTARLMSYAGNKAETKLDLSSLTELDSKSLGKLSFDDTLKLSAKAKAEFESKLTVAWDSEKKELKTSGSFTLSADAAAALDIAGDKSSIAGKARVTLTRVYSPTPSDLKAIDTGKMSTLDAMTRASSKLVVKLEAEDNLSTVVGGANVTNPHQKGGQVISRLKGEMTFDSAGSESLESILSSLKKGKWTVEYEAAVSEPLGLNFEAVKAQINKTHRHKDTIGPGTLNDALMYFGQQGTSDDELTALRATANTR